MSASAGDTSWIPSLGRFHIQQSNQACMSQLPKPERPAVHALQQEKPPQGEAYESQSESNPPQQVYTATLKTQCSQKLNK